MLPLSKTAALVMSWASPLYGQGIVGSYVNDLDLSQASELIAECEDICPWYGEVILNRKFLIREWVDEWLSTEGNDQVMILAAGMAPLGLEILEGHDHARVVEVDVEHMGTKREAFHSIEPGFDDRIAFLESDICSDDLWQELSTRFPGFDVLRPTLFIMEGVSYYLSEPDLRRLTGSILSRKNMTFILEYLVPSEEVVQSRRSIPDRVFRCISDDSGISCRRYSAQEVNDIMVCNGGMVQKDVSMHEMEIIRMGHPETFPDNRSGWIRCSLINS